MVLDPQVETLIVLAVRNLSQNNEADVISDHVCLALGAYDPGHLLMGSASDWRARWPGLEGC